MPKHIPEIDLIRVVDGKKSEKQKDLVASEEPLEIRIQGKSVAVTMRTPGHDEELAAGFLVSEGLLKNRDEILGLEHCRAGEESDNILNVFLAPAATFDLAQLSRHVFASSSCGICGKASIELIRKQFAQIGQHGGISAKTIAALPDKLRAAQETFSVTGGLHAAALFDETGEMLCLREDVGRHNAMDKIIGRAFLDSRLPLSNHIALVSGRASFEIMQKAWAAGIPIVAAVSAPSSLAIELASESGQTLIGFLRGQSFNIYTHPDRIRTG